MCNINNISCHSFKCCIKHSTEHEISTIGDSWGQKQEFRVWRDGKIALGRSPPNTKFNAHNKVGCQGGTILGPPSKRCIQFCFLGNFNWKVDRSQSRCLFRAIFENYPVVNQYKLQRAHSLSMWVHLKQMKKLIDNKHVLDSLLQRSSSHFNNNCKYISYHTNII